MQTPYLIVYITMGILLTAWGIACANVANFSIIGTPIVFVLSLPFFYVLAMPFMLIAGIIQGHIDLQKNR